MNPFLPPSLGAAIGEIFPSRPLDWRGSGCVLVVDDEDPVRVVVARAITRLGFSSNSASSGRDAVALFEKDPAQYVLVILDVKMPVMDGLETMSRLRQLRPDVPVILMSGYNQLEVPNMVAVTGFLHKPFTLDALASEIRAVVEA
jgi:two-component system, cell cycle sensor histidine kinase and response regulator CckA